MSIVAGGVVTTNEQLARLIDGDALEVAFRISTAQYTRLLDVDGSLISSPVTATMEAFGMNLETTGVITRDSGAVGEGQTGRLLFARLDRPNGMKPGDFVTVSVSEPPLERVVRLPASALGADGQVLTVGDEGRLKTVPVVLMRRQGDQILVRSEQLTGEDVVNERSPLLGAGIKVRVLSNLPNTLEEASLYIELSVDRRDRLIAFVEGDSSLSDDAKARMIGTLSETRVPSNIVQRLENRMGG